MDTLRQRLLPVLADRDTSVPFPLHRTATRAQRRGNNMSRELHALRYHLYTTRRFGQGEKVQQIKNRTFDRQHTLPTACVVQHSAAHMGLCAPQ